MITTHFTCINWKCYIFCFISHISRSLNMIIKYISCVCNNVYIKQLNSCDLILCSLPLLICSLNIRLHHLLRVCVCAFLSALCLFFPDTWRHTAVYLHSPPYMGAMFLSTACVHVVCSSLCIRFILFLILFRSHERAWWSEFLYGVCAFNKQINYGPSSFQHIFYSN